MPAVLVPRRFSELSQDRRAGEPNPIQHYFGYAAFVVLGEPGMGKTTAFENAAREEPGSVYLSVRQFLRTPSGHWANKTLYLDGLDESRAARADRTGVIDSVVQRLCEAGSPRFRLSCRPADWKGGGDKTALRDSSADGRVAILRLQPLSDDDVLAIAAGYVPDPEEFGHEAEVRGLETLLHNPQTLTLLLEVVAGGKWPDTRAHLFREACRLLLGESNLEHSRAVDDWITPRKLWRAAGCLSAVQLLSDVEGFALTTAVATPDYPALQGLGEPLAELNAAARRRMFASPEPELITPPHRTIAEFMAGSYLAQRVAEGLPVGRVLALMTGPDGGTISDLRGLYAWLVTLCRDYTDELLQIDPVAAVLYGDASDWPLSTKRLALAAFRNVGKADPYFRAGHWTGTPFGALADPGLVRDLLIILTECWQDHHQLRTVLDIAQYGKPLPGLGDALLAVAGNQQVRDSFRAEGIAVFAHCCPDRQSELHHLLEQVHRGEIVDSYNVLRAALLKALYPNALGPSDILQYLVPEDQGHASGYAWFQANHLSRLTPKECLCELADVLADKGPPMDTIAQLSWSRLVGAVLHRILAEFDPVEPACLYRWLAAGMSRNGHQTLRKDDQEIVRRYLSGRPLFYKALFLHWTKEEDLDSLWPAWHRFNERVCHTLLPSDFSIWLLGEMAMPHRADVTPSLFRLSCRLILNGTSPEVSQLETLFQWADRWPEYKDILHSMCVCVLDSDYLKHRVDMKELTTRQDTELRRLRQSWTDAANQNADGVRLGQSLEILIHFGSVWSGRFIHLDSQAEPTERLVSETNGQIAEALEQGFVALLQREDLPSPAEIGRLKIDSKVYAIGEAMLAGLDIVAGRSKDEFLSLPYGTLALGMCLTLTYPDDPTREWPSWLNSERAELAADALVEFWRPLIGARVDDVPGLHDLMHAKEVPTGCCLIRRLLHEFPDAHAGILRGLAAAALQHCGVAIILQLAREVPDLPSAVRLQWTAAAFLVEPSMQGEALVRLAGNDHGRIRELFVFLHAVWDPSRHHFDSRVLEPLIAILGSTYENVPESWSSGPVDPFDAEHAARFVRELIDRLGYEPHVGAGISLQRLLADARLKSWHAYLKHASAGHARRRRETLFRYADVEHVVVTLSHQAPANLADLQTIVTEHLRDLARQYRCGATDGWKTFWNTNRHGRAESPKIENQCRDRLLEHLKPRLTKHAVTADREGSFAEDKRSDIKVTAAGSMVLPVEIKRHYHADLWVSLTNQLQQFYARDPEAGGRGIYLVLWFGEAKNRRLPPPPVGLVRPRNAVELEARLRETILHADHPLLEVVVVDCGEPAKP